MKVSPTGLLYTKDLTTTFYLLYTFHEKTFEPVTTNYKANFTTGFYKTRVFVELTGEYKKEKNVNYGSSDYT